MNKHIKSMKKKLISFLLSILVFAAITKEAFPLNIPESWIYSVVYIVNTSTNNSGTGFLVARQINEKGGAVIFLVSNKHVLMPRPLSGKPDEAKEAKAVITINRIDSDETKIFTKEVLLRDAQGKEFVKGNPNLNIDVAALEFTGYISENGKVKQDLKIGFIPEVSFASKEKLRDNFVTIGDNVTVLGYPLNLVEGGHCIPIARGGVIASDPTHDFRNLPAILIDSTMVRGSSGSPVILPFLAYKFTSASNINQLEVTQAQLLGIIAETIPDWTMELKKTIAVGAPPETVSVIAVANLGLLFKSETITETINQFGRPVWKAPEELKRPEAVKKTEEEKK